MAGGHNRKQRKYFLPIPEYRWQKLHAWVCTFTVGLHDKQEADVYFVLCEFFPMLEAPICK
jgi:hypothetical protein